MQYNVGLYGGSFNPLHLGHIDCIIQAANMCRELYIILSIGNNRQEIDFRVRYRWLYQTTKHIGNVKILTLEDSCEEKTDYTIELAREDCEWVKEKIGKPIDVIFCGSDYGKDSFWNVCYPDCEHFVFRRNGISSTRIRNTPYQYWDWIPDVVRPYYNKKVLIIGGESTGKSTLTINLAKRFNTNYIDEAGRELSEKSGTDLMMLSEDFTEILLQHKLNEIKAIEHSNKVLFIDTDSLVTQFYMDFLDDPQKIKNKMLSDAIDSINDYDIIFFLDIDVPFVQDGGRSEEIRDNRMKYSEQLKNVFISHGRKFITLTGTYQERYVTAVKEINNLLYPNNL